MEALTASRLHRIHSLPLQIYLLFVLKSFVDSHHQRMVTVLIAFYLGEGPKVLAHFDV